jgi:hypothetical protein
LEWRLRRTARQSEMNLNSGGARSRTNCGFLAFTRLALIIAAFNLDRMLGSQV